MTGDVGKQQAGSCFRTQTELRESPIGELGIICCIYQVAMHQHGGADADRERRIPRPRSVCSHDLFAT